VSRLKLTTHSLCAADDNNLIALLHSYVLYALQVEALNALQNLTDKLSHRVVLRDDVHNWEDIVLLAMSRFETQLASVVVADDTGRETRQELQVSAFVVIDVYALVDGSYLYTRSHCASSFAAFASHKCVSLL
jgi:hypothetical protein